MDLLGGLLDFLLGPAPVKDGKDPYLYGGSLTQKDMDMMNALPQIPGWETGFKCVKGVREGPGMFQTPLGDLVEYIRGFEGVVPEYARSEEDLEQMLYVYLGQKYPGRCARQVIHPYGRTDMVIDGEYGIELKLVKHTGMLEALIGQAAKYKKAHSGGVVLVLYVDDRSRFDMAPYLQEYDRMGVRYVVIAGEIRRGR